MGKMSLFLDIWRLDTILTAEAKYPINFTQPRTRFALSLHYNGRNSFLFVDAESFLFDQWWNNNKYQYECLSKRLNLESFYM